ncbi:MAG: hypothetical protein WCT26_05015 [Candidatus Buchananbacteria bacterium]|jgi:hypothetical protein
MEWYWKALLKSALVVILYASIAAIAVTVATISTGYYDNFWSCIIYFECSLGAAGSSLVIFFAEKYLAE